MLIIFYRVSRKKETPFKVNTTLKLDSSDFYFSTFFQMENFSWRNNTGKH